MSSNGVLNDDAFDAPNAGAALSANGSICLLPGWLDIGSKSAKPKSMTPLLLPGAAVAGRGPATTLAAEAEGAKEPKSIGASSRSFFF